MPYYPKHYITTGLYTNGNEYAYASNPSVEYTGSYYLLANGQAWSGETPQYTYRQLLTPIKKSPELETSNTQTQVTVIKTSNVPYGAESIKEGVLFAQTVNTTPANLQLVRNYTQQVGSTAKQLPLGTQPTPTEQEYSQGQYQRYFCKKTNQNAYLEVSKETYDALSKHNPQYYWELYITFQITWLLSGPKDTVAQTNARYVHSVMRSNQLPGFDKYLREDYLKFYK